MLQLKNSITNMRKNIANIIPLKNALIIIILILKINNNKTRLNTLKN